MMIAPHPDDESLDAGVLLQRAVAARSAVRIVYATDGDDNPWPQRLLEKRWRLNDADRARWGKRRRKEAIAALSMLGLSGAHARFLGLPDQGNDQPPAIYRVAGGWAIRRQHRPASG